jgi:transaldolase
MRFNSSDVDVVPRIDDPVNPDIVTTLMKFPDFVRAYNEDGLSREEFDTYPPTRRTLRQFIAACHELDGQIRDLMIPNPDN